MNFFFKISPEWTLRIGFAAMYFYSGVRIFSAPQNWAWAVPSWFSGAVTSLGFDTETYLKLQAIGEVVFALAFLAWFLRPAVLEIITVFAAVEMAGILLLGGTGINSITFRDLGILGGLIALVIIFGQTRKTEDLVGKDLIK